MKAHHVACVADAELAREHELVVRWYRGVSVARGPRLRMHGLEQKASVRHSLERSFIPRVDGSKAGSAETAQNAFQASPASAPCPAYGAPLVVSPRTGSRREPPQRDCGSHDARDRRYEVADAPTAHHHASCRSRAPREQHCKTPALTGSPRLANRADTPIAQTHDLASGGWQRGRSPCRTPDRISDHEGSPLPRRWLPPRAGRFAL